MEPVLQHLVKSLQEAKSQLNDLKGPLAAALHKTDDLPDRRLSSLASEALDLLSDIKIFLEPSQVVLADHFFGYKNTKALCAAVELNIPDVLHGGPRTVEELASECEARPDRLRQVMRTLHNNGIFTYDDAARTYRNNHTSTLLMKNHWTQWHNWIELYGNEFYDMSRGIPASCRRSSARCPAQINFDTDDTMFKYFSDRGWNKKFHTTLSAGAIAQSPGIIQDYPWEEVATSTVVDVGGGGGALISLLLRRYDTMKGIILETPQVIGQARANFHGPDGPYADVASQIPPENLIAGDFFHEVTPSDVYTMKWCLHNWDDEKAVHILKTIRRSIKRTERSRLVILESVIRDGHRGKISRYGDLNMMVAVGGGERDESQWRDLADRSGWELRKIYSLRNAWSCAIEFIPVWTAKAGLPDEALSSPDTVVSEMRFLEPWDGTKGNPYVRRNPPPGFDHTNFEWRSYSVKFRDARPNKDQFTLDTHGFAYFDDDIPQIVIDTLRGNDPVAVRMLYYPYVAKLVQRITGAPRVIIFDHTLRKRRPELDKTENDDGKEQPATIVHCDQSENGALARLRDNINSDENAEDLLKRRVQMINIWRPLNGPVQDWPLATMDYQSVRLSDMHPCDLLAGEDEERGQTVTFTYSAEQAWYYLDRQGNSEVTAVKIWDSDASGVSKFCAHSAFQHPGADPDAEPRESIEVRCLVLH
ncbi:S-adenosyl-L-methionine-dependent methyltransferase [Xylaria palmicola]|nr:S-adenosyl-L-methionine-dependent methyltransferase [Xylaria palmicola]